MTRQYELLHECNTPVAGRETKEGQERGETRDETEERDK
jgi:hypothetical protein